MKKIVFNFYDGVLSFFDNLFNNFMLYVLFGFIILVLTQTFDFPY
jgi:hypothetical protein